MIHDHLLLPVVSGCLEEDIYNCSYSEKYNKETCIASHAFFHPCVFNAKFITKLIYSSQIKPINN